MPDGDDAHTPRHAPLHRNGEYLRRLLGDLLLDIGIGIGAFVFPLITLQVIGSLGATGLVGLVQGIGPWPASSPAGCSPTAARGIDSACSPRRPGCSCRPC